jgi:hypothetical protein
VSTPLTPDDLKTMRLRDSAVPVYRDTFGGEYVLNKDGRMHGQHAIMDRRRLLEHLSTLAQLDIVAKDIVQIQPTISTRDRSAGNGLFGVGQMRECGWVIEAPPIADSIAQGLLYLFIEPGATDNVKWTSDARKALRFARDADCVAFMNLSPVLSAILTRPAFKEWVTPC